MWRENAIDQGGFTYQIEINDVNGNLPPETKLGRLLNGHAELSEKDKMNHTFTGRSGGCFTLNPGKSLTDEVNLSALYDLNQPGAYMVYVVRIDPVTGTRDTSNTVTMTVTP